MKATVTNMDYARAAARLAKAQIDFSENISLAPYTSFRIGGPAKLVVFPFACSEIIEALDILREENIRITMLGNGTNVLVSDKGFDGAVIITTRVKACLAIDGEITAFAGTGLTHLASVAAKSSLTGLEFAYGIPGTVGGAIFMNAGAYGGEMSQVVEYSSYYDLATGEMGVFKGDEHDFSYRHSIYTDSSKIVLKAQLKLREGNADEIQAKMNDYMTRRREKQPLEYPSAGSTFKRGNGFITAQIIDEAGLKGRSVGDAQVSEKHAGFIINRANASANEVLELIAIVKDEVKTKFGLDIECEVRYIE